MIPSRDPPARGVAVTASLGPHHTHVAEIPWDCTEREDADLISSAECNAGKGWNKQRRSLLEAVFSLPHSTSTLSVSRSFLRCFLSKCSAVLAHSPAPPRPRLPFSQGIWEGFRGAAGVSACPAETFWKEDQDLCAAAGRAVSQS